MHRYKQPAHHLKHAERHASSVSENAEGPVASTNQSPARLANRWDALLPTKKPAATVNRYPHNLTPAPSPLRPMCAAADRLRLWRPLQTSPQNGTNPFISIEERECIKDLMSNTWQEITKATYSPGLLTFHVFCDQRSVDEAARAPAGTDLIVAFISAMASSLAGSTIGNYINGIRIWHIIHDIAWSIDHLAVDAVLRAATVSAPTKSSKPPRQPVMIDYLTAILSHLNKDDPSTPQWPPASPPHPGQSPAWATSRWKPSAGSIARKTSQRRKPASAKTSMRSKFVPSACHSQSQPEKKANQPPGPDNLGQPIPGTHSRIIGVST